MRFCHGGGLCVITINTCTCGPHTCALHSSWVTHLLSLLQPLPVSWEPQCQISCSSPQHLHAISSTSSSLCGTIAEERQHLLIIDCSSSHVVLESIYLALHVVSLVVLSCNVLTCTLPLRYCTHEFTSHGTLAPTFRTLPRWAGVGDVKS